MNLYNNKRYLLVVFLLMLPFYTIASEVTNEVINEVTEPSTTEIIEEISTDAVVKDATYSFNRESSSGGHFMQMIIGLFVVLVCILVLAWFAKKINRFQSISDESLKIIGSLGMGSRERIVLLQVADQQLLLGVTAGQINILHVLGDTVEASNKQSSDLESKSFSDKLKKMMTATETSVPNQQSKK